jgi:hypothetical protein
LILRSLFSILIPSVVDAFPVVGCVDVFEAIGVAFDEGVSVFVREFAARGVLVVLDNAVAELVVFNFLAAVCECEESRQARCQYCDGGTAKRSFWLIL